MLLFFVIYLLLFLFFRGIPYIRSWRMTFDLDGYEMCSAYRVVMFFCPFYYPCPDCDERGYPETGGYFGYIDIDNELILIGDYDSLYSSWEDKPYNTNDSFIRILSKHRISSDTSITSSHAPIIKEEVNSRKLYSYCQLYDYLRNEKKVDPDDIEIKNIFREIKRLGRKTKVHGYRFAVNLDSYLSESDEKITSIKEYWHELDTSNSGSPSLSISGVVLCESQIHYSFHERFKTNYISLRFCDMRKFSTKEVFAYAKNNNMLYFFEGTPDSPFFLEYNLENEKVNEYYSTEEFNIALEMKLNDHSANVASLDWQPAYSINKKDSQQTISSELKKFIDKWKEP